MIMHGYTPFIPFNERAFPVAPELAASHTLRVRRGRERMAKSSVVICGLARDLGPNVSRMIGWIENLGAAFRDYRVVIVENSSRDGTRDALELWTRRNRHIHILGGDAGVRRFGSTRERERTEMLANLRESYRRLVAAEIFRLDYAIVLDTDLAAGWSPQGIADTFGGDGWDGVTSNGLIHIEAKVHGRKTQVWRQIYYDSWAFRAPRHPEAHLNTPVNRMHLERGGEMIPVFSAFGGMAIYRMTAFLSSRYEGDDCEHVSFHVGMRNMGYGRLYLNPSQIVLYNLPPSGALILAPEFTGPGTSELAVL